MRIYYSKSYKYLLPFLMLAIILQCCVGTIYSRGFFIRGTPFFPEDNIDIETFVIYLSVTGSSSRHNTDSLFSVSMSIDPDQGSDSANIDFLKGIELQYISLERVNYDSLPQELNVLHDTIKTCGSRASHYCRCYDFGKIKVFPSVDTMRIHLLLSYGEDTLRIIKDTIVDMHYAEAKHTGVIDY